MIFARLIVTLLSLLALNNVSLSLPLPCSNITSDGYNALHSFYTSTNGTNWTSTCNNWNFSNLNDTNAPCNNNWYGITCRHCSIIQLHLPNCNLVGSIPKALMMIHTLESIILNSNALTNTIPNEIYNLTMLNALVLYSNGNLNPPLF